MRLSYEIEKIRENPGEHLTEACVLSLGAFLAGYRLTDAGYAATLDALTRRFEGSVSADACTRAYLTSTTSERALRRVLDELSSMLAAAPEPESRPGPYAGHGFVDHVREPIVSGRTGLVFFVPTVIWCANYWKGFLAGLSASDPAAAARERARFRAFEQWLGERFSHPRAPWYALIRVYEGHDLDGLRGFISQWDEFERSSQAAG